MVVASPYLRIQRALENETVCTFSASRGELVYNVELDNSNAVVRKLHIYAHSACRGFRIWIVNTRLFQPPITTRMPISVAVKQIVLFTMLQSFLKNPEE